MGNRAPRLRLAGTGRATPKKILTNADLETLVDTSDEWITERTGIKQRHIAEADEANSDFALPAARQALEDAGMEPGDLDAIVCATVTADNPWPSLACKVQAELGARGTIAFDLSAACTGWIYSLGVAEGFFHSGMAKNILVLGSECLSKIVNWNDRQTCVLFGDGSGATVLTPSDDDRGILSCALAADGRHYELLYQPAGGSGRPPTHESVSDNLHTIHMNGKEVFKHAVRNMVRLANEAMAKAEVQASDIDMFIPHQANLRIIDGTTKMLGVDPAKVYVNVDRYGNTSAASIPIALDEARREGVVEPGQLVCLVAFGGGFTYGATVIRL
jgi:3-oxoacyl-[acyl-carrier-protein] synthase-3